LVSAQPVEEIDVGGRRLVWRSVGRGPKLLLINGYAATSLDWDPAFLMGLARSFEVICPDNRGVGESELGTGDLTIDGMAADLEALLDALELERVPVVGWSMGGFIAQRLAIRSPDRLNAMALLATSPGGSEAALAEAAVWFRLTDHSGTPRVQASRLISLLFPPESAAEMDRRFGDLIASARETLSPQALTAQEGAMAAWHSSQQSGPDKPATLPTLVVHGSADIVIPPENSGPLAARWGASQVKLFPGCAHAFFSQEPERAAHLIASFCSA
jgi:pimeloyl-ACP methyl ester carboxylesterase